MQETQFKKLRMQKIRKVIARKQFNNINYAAAAKLLQSCPTLCDPIDGSPPGSPVPGTLQARVLEWVAISFSNAWKWKVKVKSLSCVWLLVTPWTTAHQAPPFQARVLEWGAIAFSSAYPNHKLISLSTLEPRTDVHRTVGSLRFLRKTHIMRGIDSHFLNYVHAYQVMPSPLSLWWTKT